MRKFNKQGSSGDVNVLAADLFRFVVGNDTQLLLISVEMYLTNNRGAIWPGANNKQKDAM
jgi:hypothetical protein